MKNIFSPFEIIKASFILLPVIFFAVLINHHIVITPHLSYAYRPGQKPKIIVPERLPSIVRTADPDVGWKITSETFPFSVRFPRVLASIRIQTKLRNINQPLITFTAKGKEAAGDMQTIVHSTVLQNLDWKKVSDGQRTLWMRAQRTIVQEHNNHSRSPSHRPKRNTSKPAYLKDYEYP